jgi:hypothetical protein
VANPRSLSLGVRIVQAYRKGEPLLRPLERLHRAAEEPQGQRPVHASAHAGIVASIHELVRPVPLRIVERHAPLAVLVARPKVRQNDRSGPDCVVRLEEKSVVRLVARKAEELLSEAGAYPDVRPHLVIDPQAPGRRELLRAVAGARQLVGARVDLLGFARRPVQREEYRAEREEEIEFDRLARRRPGKAAQQLQATAEVDCALLVRRPLRGHPARRQPVGCGTLVPPGLGEVMREDLGLARHHRRERSSSTCRLDAAGTAYDQISRGRLVPVLYLG